MARLFGHNWTRRQLESHAALDQVAGLTRTRLQDGFEHDVEHIELRTGGGLRVGFAPSRGLDPVWAAYNEYNLTWRGGNGVAHPAYYQENNLGWLRGFPGGLLTTCGLSSFGPPCEDNGEYYGLHDRISYTPAREVAATSHWIDDDTCAFTISGTLRQTRIFGPNLRLERTYTARLGENRLALRDTLTNDGFTPEAAVILYHCNFGFPLVEVGAVVRLNVISTTARDAHAEMGADRWREMDEPTVGIAERCYFHDAQPEADGHVEAGIWNQRLKLGVNLRYAKSQLPHFTQWKMLGAGTYVCGLEPSNAHLASRADLRADAALPVLEPGESRVFDLEWSVVHEL